MSIMFKMVLRILIALRDKLQNKTCFSLDSY